MKVYTKTGDKGQTSLYDGCRVDKDDVRVEAYGTIDELNAALGFGKNFINDEEVYSHIEWIQRKLFNVGGELAMRDGSSFPECVTEDDIKQLEDWIDEYLNKNENDPGFKFILPGSNMASGALELPRTISRRAERRMITLSKQAEISSTVMKFVNRLSDTIYMFGRYLQTETTVIDFDKKKK